MLKEISREELSDLIESGEDFKLVDVLSRESFAKGHIKGAVSIPLAEIGRKSAKLLKKRDKIVTYCASFECSASTTAARKLIALGYKNVFDYKGGLKDYQEGGLSLETGAGQADKKCTVCGGA
ncbi:MAG: rhodanese-like domain-containing protein [Candidatus Omnitrophica bacterium]|nr:rhodanese-like domain-containing protein [Candidatus Omnitrophota bacterium]